MASSRPESHDAPIAEGFAPLWCADSGPEKLDVSVGYPGAPLEVVRREVLDAGTASVFSLVEKMLKSGQEQLDGWGLAGYGSVV